MHAARRVLDKAGWTARDVDLYEINEAFAVVTMIALDELGIGHDRLNVNGGACALGHPVGATGARLLVTLVHALKQRGLQRGLASLCLGGGEAWRSASNCAEGRAMTLQSRIEGAVGWLTMDRPAAMNSLNREMAAAMTAQLKAWRDDSAVRAVVLTGNGRAFCAGADLKEVAEPPVTGEPDFLDVVVGFVDTLRSFPKPVIAAVNGLALAGGLETVMACDLVLAAESAKLGDAHSNFGVFPGAGGAAVLPRKVPANVARWLLFTGAALPPHRWSGMAWSTR